MKNTYPSIVVIAVTICTGLLLGRPKWSTAAGEPTDSGYSRSGEDSIQQQIISKEREELDSLKTGNLDLFGNLLAEDALFLDAHGPAGKAEVVKNVGEFRLLDYIMEDVRFVPLSAQSGLIAYKLTEKGTSHGKDFAGQVYVSAVWIERGGKWVCLFSQETGALIPKPQAPR
jgi:hypothetical protein